MKHIAYNTLAGRQECTLCGWSGEFAEQEHNPCPTINRYGKTPESRQSFLRRLMTAALAGEAISTDTIEGFLIAQASDGLLEKSCPTWRVTSAIVVWEKGPPMPVLELMLPLPNSDGDQVSRKD